jgi:hypothetical protein
LIFHETPDTAGRRAIFFQKVVNRRSGRPACSNAIHSPKGVSSMARPK